MPNLVTLNGRRLIFKRSWVQIPVPDSSHLFVVKLVFEKTENKQKDAGDGPFKKPSVTFQHMKKVGPLTKIIE